MSIEELEVIAKSCFYTDWLDYLLAGVHRHENKVKEILSSLSSEDLFTMIDKCFTLIRHNEDERKDYMTTLYDLVIKELKKRL